MNKDYNLEINTNFKNQSQKGFKTFVLTLSISLIVFSIVYFLTTDSSLNYDYEKDALSDSSLVKSSQQSVLENNNMLENNLNSNDSNQSVIEKNVLGESDYSKIEITSDASSTVQQKSITSNINLDTNNEINLNPKQESLFGELNESSISDTSKAVLSDSASAPSSVQTKVSTSAVPSSGITEITWGIFVSLIAFLLGFIVISQDPRKIAIRSFEEEMLK